MAARGDRRAHAGQSERLHVTRQATSSLLNGNAGLSAGMAIRFEKAFGLSAETMMRMQAAHQLAQARAREREIEVEKVAAQIGWPRSGVLD